MRIYWVAGCDFLNTVLFLGFLLRYAIISQNVSNEVEKDIV